MNPSFQWQAWFLRPNYHYGFSGPVDVQVSGADTWVDVEIGEDGEMDSVQTGMDIFLGCIASEGRLIYDKRTQS